MRTEILVFDGFEELDALGPLSVLSLAGFEVSLVTVDGTEVVRGARGTRVCAERALSDSPQLLVVPGGGWNDRAEHGAWAEAQRGETLAAIRARHLAGSRLAGVCTGTMLIAATGLLAGRRAVTHHLALDELAASGAQVVGHARVVDEGEVVTAGGVTAGIDLALWLVERELGAPAAARVAAEMEHPRVGTVERVPPRSQRAPEVALTRIGVGIDFGRDAQLVDDA